jgi:hypothetical protein
MAIAYRTPVTGAVAPTAEQARPGLVVATAAAGAGATDDATDIVHNMNMSPADGSTGMPLLSCVLIAQGSAAKMPTLTFKDKDTITVTMAAKGANCDLTALVTIQRPHSLIRGV